MRSTAPQPFWPPLTAGIALGLVLLATFLVTGHGLGATGFFTRLTAWLGTEVAPRATAANDYLGPIAATGRPLADWISWELVGVLVGAVVASGLARRFRIQVEGARRIGSGKRFAFALLGGVLAGFGARLAAGCTSGIGLSGSATLAVAGFVFLGGFFAMGLAVSWLLRKERS